jgi:hypothetical protein
MTIRIKAGETLLLQVKALEDDNSDGDLTNVDLTAQARTTLNVLVANLPVVKTADPAIATITVGATSAWPVGTHRMDFRAVIAGVVAYTETVDLVVGFPVTVP